MTDNATHILYIDDYSFDRDLVRDALTESNHKFKLTEATTRTEFETELAVGGYDLVLSDFNILGFDGLQVLAAVQAQDPHVPVIIVTGTGSEEVAAQAIKQGAADYVIKTPNHIQRLPYTIKTVLEQRRLQQERQQAATALQESQQYLQAIFENAQNAILLADDNAYYIDANPAACQLLGYSRDELIGLHLSQITPGINHRDATATWQSFITTGRQSGEFILLHKDGSQIEAEYRAVANILPGLHLSIMHDITDRKRAEQALRESEQKYRRLAENSPAIIYRYRFGPERGFDYISPAITTLIGYSPAEHYADPNLALKIIHPDDRQRLKQLMRTPQTQHNQSFTFRWIRKDGATIWTEHRIVLVYDESGAVVALEGIALDITPFKQSEQKLAWQARQMATLHDISVEINSQFDLPALLNTIIEQAVKLVQVERGLLTLLNPETTLLELAGVYNYPADQLKSTLQANEGLAGQVIQQNKPVAIRHYDTWAEKVKPLQLPFSLGRILGVPLKMARDPIGVLVVADSEPGDFSPAEIQLLNQFATQAATAITKTRLIETTRQRLQELEALQQASLTLGRLFDPVQIGQRVIEIIEGLLGYRRTAILTLDEKGDGLRLLAHSSMGLEPAALQADLTYVRQVVKAQRGITAWVIKHGRPVRSDNVKEDPRYVEADPKIQSELCVPLKVSGRTIGALNVEHEQRNAFTDHDERLLTTLAGQVAISLENSRLLQKERRRTDQLEALRQTGLELTSQLDLDSLLHSIAARAVALLEGAGGGLYLYRADQDVLEWRVAIGPKPIPIGTTFERGEGVSGKILEQDQPLIVNDYPHWPDRIELPAEKSFTAIIGTPIRWGDEILGVINVLAHAPRTFGPEDIELLEMVATQAAIAIHNAQLFEAVQSGRRRLQTLSHQLVEAQEQERYRLARELHDEIGQSLTAVKINLQTIQRAPSPEWIEQGIAIVEHAIQQVRSLSLDLRPSLLDDLGLAAALHWQLDRQALVGGFETNLIIEPKELTLSPALETTCYRLVQEALTNIHRHAQASQGWLTLQQQPAELRLTIKDNGRGFNFEQARQRAMQGHSLGVLGMEERVLLFEGTIKFETAPGAGTTIQIRFPLDKQRPLHKRLMK